MSQYFEIHAANPQQRLISRAVAVVRAGGVIVYPTDSCYALGCCLGDKAPMERIRRIRKVDSSHNFTLLCRDLSEIANYARVDNRAFRLMKSLTPGPFTFVLQASREVPRRLQNPRRKTIGLRVPANAIAQALLESLGEPLMSSTLLLPGDDLPLTDPHEMRERLGSSVDLVIDGGYCGLEPTTVLDLTGETPKVLRRGRGDVSLLSL
ncbi:MAG: threonylcarbamoyl-AMP synthase [Gammaproteobacteria bacterium]|nr:threonylcarbamoyl-AMP synthase [Gammaproteobacteria bacterium]NIM71617.1 threonylcarbamoyl-AMP synthase [Gammaproteobacteria bacterium]NIN37165.1 threonylcarbamoyl-AMP synthase [Gammaproteobacteria bacterium]NIO23357.1 threonylcarbamoyl-AMP synthase [Gammaproteobacteria bacterium]NIO63985.1 threonylcarbamoyl-AMP synthase [Gammaproteobacteria bacterium]